MRSLPALRHFLLLAVVGLTFGLLLLDYWPTSSAVAPPTLPGSVVQWGGGPGHNLVNLTDKGLPLTWSTKAGQQKNIKWSVDLGSSAYAGPIIAGGKVYLGNEKGEIYVFQHGRRHAKPTVVKMGTVSTKVRATPVAAGGVLYVVTENPCKLWAIAAR